MNFPSGIALDVAIVVTGNTFPSLANIEGGALPYTEGDGAVSITSTITVSDVDSPDFETGTLTVDFIAGGTANDGLFIRDEGAGAGQIGVVSEFVRFEGTNIGTFAGGMDNADPLQVSFFAAATVTVMQALLRNITYENLSEHPSTAPRTVRFVLTDGDGGVSNAATRTINVTAINDAPVLASLEASALAFMEGDVAMPLTAAITITDADDTNLESAMIQITSNYRNGEDVLAAIGLPGGITAGAFDTTDGVISLSGSASVGDYQTALRQVTYQNTGDPPNTSTRTVTFTVGDGADDSNQPTRNITVTATNDVPVIGNLGGDSLTYNEGDAAVVIDQGTVATVTDDDSGRRSGW